MATTVLGVKRILGSYFIGNITLGRGRDNTLMTRGRTEYSKNYKPYQYLKQTQTKRSLTFFAKRDKVWELFGTEISEME